MQTLIGSVITAAAARSVQRAANAEWTAVQNVGVDHRGGNVAMAKKFLDGPDVVTGFEQMGGKAVTEAVASSVLGNPSSLHCRAEGALEDGLVQVMAIQ